MTMHEQELTLFGGWAKAQIPPQIEIGVVRPSDTLSASIYFKVEQKEPFSFEGLGKTHIYQPHIKIESEGALPTIELKRYYTISYHNQEMNRWIDNEERAETLDYAETELAIPGEKGMRSTWSRVFYSLFLDKSFFRFFEIWVKGSLADMMRGYLGKEKLQKSFNGKIGGNYDVGRSKKPITKLENGEWTLSKERELYPHVKRLPSEGIANARKLARALREKKIAARQARFEHGAK